MERVDHYRRRGRCARCLLAASGLLILQQVGVGDAMAAFILSTIDGAATVDGAARRGQQFQSTDTLPPPPGCHRVIVIGDSLMDNARPWLVADLQDAGLIGLVDAHHTRRIPSTVPEPYSGVTAARSARLTWGEADCWVIALGSNDLIYGAGEPAAADALIQEMLAALTPGALVFWVNLDYHHDPAVAFNFPKATAAFNLQLDQRAAVDPDLEVIDWYSYAEAHLNWFFDPVHVDRAGSIARARFTVDALPAPTDRDRVDRLRPSETV